MTLTLNFKNSRWRTAAILKLIKSPYLNEKSSDFDEIYTTAHLELDSHLAVVIWTKYEHFKFQDEDCCRFKNRFLAIIQQPIVFWCQWNFVWRSSFSQNFCNGTDTRIPQNVIVVFLMQFGFGERHFLYHDRYLCFCDNSGNLDQFH